MAGVELPQYLGDVTEKAEPNVTPKPPAPEEKPPETEDARHKHNTIDPMATMMS